MQSLNSLELVGEPGIGSLLWNAWFNALWSGLVCMWVYACACVSVFVCVISCEYPNRIPNSREGMNIRKFRQLSRRPLGMWMFQWTTFNSSGGRLFSFYVFVVLWNANSNCDRNEWWPRKALSSPWADELQFNGLTQTQVENHPTRRFLMAHRTSCVFHRCRIKLLKSISERMIGIRAKQFGPGNGQYETWLQTVIDCTACWSPASTRDLWRCHPIGQLVYSMAIRT